MNINPSDRLVTPAPDLDEYVIQEIITESSRDLTKRVPRRFWDATITVPPVREWVTELVDLAVKDRGKRDPVINYGRSMLLIGGVGSGKTHQSYGAVRALAGSGARLGWRFVTAADAFGSLRPRDGVDGEEEFHKLARCGFLVLDDVGAEKSSEWTESVLCRLINARYDHERPTLVTTNVIGLAPVVGERVASRLAQMCTPVVMDGPDRRRAP
ncbi:MAG: ATP-binding protein [Candidatus Dormibacteria bacterium]